MLENHFTDKNNAKKKVKNRVEIYPIGVYNINVYLKGKRSEGIFAKIRRRQMEEKEKQEDGSYASGNKECCHKTKERSDKEYRDLLHRLSRIEGQVRGIKGMVEKDAYCTDILVQVAAVNAALNSFNKVLLANHIRTCVAQDIRDGKEETIDELVMTLQKLMR